VLLVVTKISHGSAPIVSLIAKVVAFSLHDAFGQKIGRLYDKPIKYFRASIDSNDLIPDICLKNVRRNKQIK